MRLANRVLAALLALALACGGVLLVVDIVAYRLASGGQPVRWHALYAWAAKTTWVSGSIRVGAVILLVIGVVLLAAELKPARASRLAADPGAAGAAGMDTAYTRKGVAAAVRTAALGVTGIHGASVRVRRRRVRVSATAVTPARSTARELTEPLRSAAAEQLDRLNLRHPPAVSARVGPGRR
jgi:hypothetical protein